MYHVALGRSEARIRVVARLAALAILALPTVARADVRAKCNTAFDADYFYFAADVDKPVLRGAVTAPFQNPLQDDAIVVALAGGPDRSRRVAMAVSVAQGAQLYRGASAKPLTGMDDFLAGPDGARMMFKYRLRPRGGLNAAPDPANGYTVELAIPWVELGGPPKPGDRLGFNVAVTSTVEGGPAVVALSPTISTREELHDASRWAEIVFVEAPAPSVTGAPGARVCARVYNVKPIIDGAPDDAEWTRLTAFSFGQGAERVGPSSVSSAEARAATALDLKPAPPAPSGGAWDLGSRRGTPPAKPHARQEWPRLLFARYLTDRQADPRKAAPLEPVADASGRSLLVTHPMDGTGPWFSYDRVDWHRIQLTRMREAGIDAAAVTYRPNRQGRLAVGALAAALEALEAAGADHPTVCLWLDVAPAALPNVATDRADAIYAAIREFHEGVPPRFTTTAPLDAANGAGFATPIVLAGSDPEAMTPDDVRTLVAALRVRFAADFGRDLIVLARTAVEGWDGQVADAAPTGYAFGGRRTVGVGTIYAGTPGLSPNEHPLFRRSRDTYRSAWRSAAQDRADWVFVETWNDYSAATEIAPTLEYGLEYVDMTHAFSRVWRGAGDLSGRLDASTLPSSTVTGRPVTVRLTIRNTGTVVWAPGSHGFLVTWTGDQRGAVAAVPHPVEMGQLCRVSVTAPAPGSIGPRPLTVSVVRLDRSGSPVSAGQNASAKIAAPIVNVVAPDAIGSPGTGGTATSLAATAVALPAVRVVEGLSLHPMALVVRNDGPDAWPAGSATVRCRLLEQVRGEEPRLLEMAEASAVIAAETRPGAEAGVSVPVAFARADGTPFRLSDDSTSRYLLRWELTLDRLGGSPALPGLALPLGHQEVQIAEADFGQQFFNDFTPTEFPGDRRVSVVIGVRNRGTRTWLKGKVAVGYHWYHLDGTEAVWQDEVFPINADLPPGGKIADVGAWVTAPPHDGSYWLVWDVRFGDTWASTRMSARAYDSRVQLVRVARGRLSFVELAPHANATISAAIGDAPVPDGMALPVELAPPLALGLPTPSTMHMAIVRSGPDQSRRISFRWLPRSKPTGVRCQGQEIAVAPARSSSAARAVHILAAATSPGATMGVTLRFADGSEQYTSFPVSVWQGPAAQGEEIAHSFPYTRIAGQDSAGPPANVYRYAIAVKERKPLVALQLSQSPAVVVAAISVER